MDHPAVSPGNIVLITGAGRGLGRLMALDFARKGCIVVIWDKQGLLCRVLFLRSNFYAFEPCTITDNITPTTTTKIPSSQHQILVNNGKSKKK